MSELKAYTFSNMEGRGLAEYYLKSEADKVIAEKDAEIARLNAIRKVHVEAIESMEAGLLQDDKAIRHHKYKRCLAMAKICQLRLERYERYLADSATASLATRRRWQFLKNHYEKWYNQWLKLAYKFKEGV